MLTVKPQLNLRNAREYFREHLSVGDYYADGQKVAGVWFGFAAAKLGLEGDVTEMAFLRLCEGLHPVTGKRLTLRKNSCRQGENGRQVANRRVFYDFTLSPPKSVSLIGLCRDDRIIALHAEAVQRALVELEKLAETRVRKSGQRGARVTGNIVAAAFRHDTSRELDPHLHTHCVVFNATHDSVENHWKALEVHGMYRAQKFVENYYFHELARGLRALGYAIENEGRAFRIKGVPESLVARFSKRRQEIDRETENRIRRAGWQGNVKDLREQVARDVRKRKLRGSTADRLRAGWDQQMTPPERSALKSLRAHRATANPADVAGIVAWADDYLFERRSVVQEHELLAAALARGRGEDFDLAALRAAIERRGYLRETGTFWLTSREVLGYELECVVAAHDGRRCHAPLAPGYQPHGVLSAEQKAAVEAILGNRDLVFLFRGGAGTGKSRTLQEVNRGLIQAHRPVVVLAPQRQQVSDLRKDGLPAETLARLLQDEQVPRGAVVILDEAGQVGGRALAQLIRLVRINGGRLILSGDTRQHGAVAASDALRAIEKYAGLQPAVLREIRRQDPALGATARERGFIRAYRRAVKAAARGELADSFARLERLGCIREYGAERRRLLAADYLAAVGRREKALVVAQTRAEACRVNEVIREQLQAEGQLGRSIPLTAYQPMDFGEAEKRDPRFYSPGQHIYFLQRYGRFAKGELCELAGTTERGLVLVKGGRRSTLSYRYTSRIAVAVPSVMDLAPGDRLQLKFNGHSREGTPLANGELVTVRRVCKNGALVVAGDGGRRKTLAPHQRLFARGYAVTSYGSQGKTVDTVIFADAANRAATDAKQWYVTVSRGRKRVVIYTPDKEELRAAIQQIGERTLALDLKAEITAPYRKLASRNRMLAAIERERQHQAVLSHVRPPVLRARIAV